MIDYELQAIEAASESLYNISKLPTDRPWSFALQMKRMVLMGLVQATLRSFIKSGYQYVPEGFTVVPKEKKQ